MTSGSTRNGQHALSDEERESLRLSVVEACEPVSPVWPLKTFAYRSPVRGLEYLPFDQAVRAGKRLLGGNGYLAVEEYRQFYRQGRITDESVRRALARVGPRSDSEAVSLGPRKIERSEVCRLHLLYGINELESSLLTWTLSAKETLDRLRDDLPSESRERILPTSRSAEKTDPKDPERSYVNRLWDCVLAKLNIAESGADDGPHEDPETSRHPEAEPVLPAQRTMSDWLDGLSGAAIVEKVNDQMMKWTAAFLDEGLAGWEMPSRKGGFYRGWRDLATRDISCRFLGIKHFARKVRELPDSPEAAIALCMRRLEIPTERWEDYQSRLFAQLPGWTGFVRWLSENPEYPGHQKHPIDLVEYLAVRLFYEVEFVDATCVKEWAVPGALPAVTAYWREHADEYRELVASDSHPRDPWTRAVCGQAWPLFHLAQFLESTPEEVEALSAVDAETLIEWLEAFPEDDHGPIWLEAYEDSYREDLVARLSAHRPVDSPSGVRPRAQLIFCIDARSEPYRRHIEEQGAYETFGYAGFFGIPMSHQAFDSTQRLALCPVLLKPSYEVEESAESGVADPLQRYASGSRWRQLGDEMFHDIKANPIGAFMLVDVLGFFFSVGLAGKTVVMGPYSALKSRIKRWFSNSVATRIPIERGEPGRVEPDSEEVTHSTPALPRGFTVNEQAAFVGNGLRIIGLTKNFGRFVVVGAHGSTSENNPYAAAYDCGACGGSHGDPNSRVFAAMANSPEVRLALAETGLDIPEDTWFLAGKHDTTTDRLAFYDLADLPSSHSDDLRLLHEALEKAGAEQALERCGRLPRTSSGMSPAKAYQHVAERGDDWANARPEWGLSSNVGFIIGRRSLTKGLSLEGRVFLHSYDPDDDDDGALLEKIMTAPLIVGEWINMEYYYSAVDPWVYGSGSKVIHNVVAGVGVMLGSQSDLQSGLPLQSVNDGPLHYHEPMRLLSIIEAPMDRIATIIGRHEILQKLFHNGWINLLALDPQNKTLHRYNTDSSWEPLRSSQAA